MPRLNRLCFRATFSHACIAALTGMTLLVIAYIEKTSQMSLCGVLCGAQAAKHQLQQRGGHAFVESQCCLRILHGSS